MFRFSFIASAFALMLFVGTACGEGSTDSYTTKTGGGTGGDTGTGGKDGTGGKGGMGGMGGMDKGADCTPGFYKNHMALWDTMIGNCGDENGEIHSNCGPYPELERACCDGAECLDLLARLKDRSPRGEGEAIRNGAKAELDACFGADEPCENGDDY